MNRKPLAELIPLLAKGIGPTTAVATGLLAPMAFGASGDLDPEFADGGRLGPIPELNGAAWSVEALDGDGVLIGGGDSDEFATTGTNATHVFSSFASVLTEDGALDAAFAAQAINDIEALDVARQADGRVVAVGRKTLGPWTTQLVAFRLGLDGCTRHGLRCGGILELSTDEYGPIAPGSGDLRSSRTARS